MRASSPRALTLIELLLVISLMSVLMAAVGGLIQMSLGVHSTFHALATTTGRADALCAQLANDLEQMQPLFSAPFVGTDSELQLVRIIDTSMPNGFIVPRWRKISYRLEPSDDGSQLIREETIVPMPGDEQEPPAVTQQTLASMTAAEFTFGWFDPLSKTLAWKAPWPEFDDGEMPQFVRFKGTISSSWPGGVPVHMERIFRNPAGFFPSLEPPT